MRPCLHLSSKHLLTRHLLLHLHVNLPSSSLKSQTNILFCSWKWYLRWELQLFWWVSLTFIYVIKPLFYFLLSICLLASWKNLEGLRKLSSSPTKERNKGRPLFNQFTLVFNLFQFMWNCRNASQGLQGVPVLYDSAQREFSERQIAKWWYIRTGCLWSW